MMGKMEMPMKGITPYPYNHKNWLRNVEWWSKHPPIDRSKDITEEMIEALIEGVKNAKIQDNQLPTNRRRVSRPDKDID